MRRAPQSRGERETLGRRMGGEDGFGVRRRSVENEKERDTGVLMALCSMSSLISGDESGPDWVTGFEEYRNGPTSVVAQCGAR